VPEETRAEIARLRDRYRLVAVVSGRAGHVAQQILSVDGIAYVGEHGLELEPEAERWRDPLARFLATVDWPRPDVENKGLTASLHYRNAQDEDVARAALEEIAARARKAGFVARFGRKVLEILPPLHADKGTALRRLLAERGLSRALYAGDDTTDLDAFRALEPFEIGIRVAVASPEGPLELTGAADLVVDGPPGLLNLLRRL
jgi:trehalose 6-phosphate phosphatase